MHTLFDLLNYSTEIDSMILAKTDGKNIRHSAPKTVADLTNERKVKR